MTLRIKRLRASAPEFAGAFRALVEANREASEDVAARRDISQRLAHDGVVLTPESLRVTAAQTDDALKSVDATTLGALRLAGARIRAFHERQKPANDRFTDAAGVELGSRWSALAAVGLYVPGGKAAYPSSVLMNAIPAAVAGVQRVVMVTPCPQGYLNPLVLAAAHEAGVHEIYRIGGAQAVGALAFGTRTIAPVDKIVGPGNAYVAEAKRQVFGRVGIDLIAGPSEIVVVADKDNDPSWIAADLISQAEHDEAAQAILITDDARFADRVVAALGSELKELVRAGVARASLEANGAIIVIDELEQAPALVDALAPEHLELAVADPEALAARVTHAGAIFLGRMTPEAIGDYVAGTNHVLPTARSARFASGLSVLDFMKRTSIVKCSAEALAAIGGAAAILAEAEGLGGHARSFTIRSNRT